MATTPEGKVKAKVKVILKELFAYYIMPVTGGFGTSGAPDFLVCLNGRFVGIECKAGKGKPTALLEKNLHGITRAGGEALVINEENVGNLRELLIWRTR